MHRRTTVVLASLAVVFASVVVVRGAGSTPPPGSDYAWAQPRCAPVTTPFAQPPAWIPAAATLAPAVPGSSYAWVQPPAWIPAC